MNWNWKKMISIVLVVTVCTTGSAIAQAVECDVPQYTFSDENIEIVDPALFYDLFTQENDINAIQDDTLDASYKYTFAPWEDNADKSDVSVDFVVVVNGVPAYGSATGVVDAYDINAGSILWAGPLNGSIDINGYKYPLILGFTKMEPSQEVCLSITIQSFDNHPNMEPVYFSIGTPLITDGVEEYIRNRQVAVGADDISGVVSDDAFKANDFYQIGSDFGNFNGGLGGTSGIGLAIAEKYLEQGHEVGICGRSQEKIDKVEKHENLKIYRLDTYDRLSFETAVKDFSKGELDIMIASAGNYSNSRTRRLTQEEAVNMLKVNISGTINAFEIAREIMLKNKKGHIAAISSVAALLEYPGASVYSKTKRVVINLCGAYREALADFGIGVTAIIPGYIDTLKLRELNNNDVSKKPFIMTEKYTADIIVKSIEENRDKIVFPIKMKIAVSILSMFPKKILSMILLRKKNEK